MIKLTINQLIKSNLKLLVQILGYYATLYVFSVVLVTLVIPSAWFNRVLMSALGQIDAVLRLILI
ncbi:hypothetical protein [Hydromonas duriensis]|uniref:Uncharacterized protein n=1 Tax=Hydromonas duriensis TaxID=1527608 RepID=A0A4R6Y5S0_9BURK|nr:hypothetical protein [Hydromonas duriensis]TDR28953.1 hypothetical protein DFR44_13022 [Hydromonas duriensis]